MKTSIALHTLGSFAPVLLFLATTGIISAQIYTPETTQTVAQTTPPQSSAFSLMSMSYSSFSSFPPGLTPYIQCVQPAIQQREQSLLALEDNYAVQKVGFVQQRGDGRLSAWTIPERSARRSAERAVDRGFRDAVRALNKSFKTQERAIYDAFRAAEDICDDQFDDDVEDPFSSSSSSSTSSFSSSVFISCFSGDMCLQQQLCIVNKGHPVNPGSCGDQSQIQAGNVCCSFSSSISSSAFSCLNNDSCIPQEACIQMNGIITSPYGCYPAGGANADYQCCHLPPPSPVCGNAVCESPETAQTCPFDCATVIPFCGNGVCEGGEIGFCQQDC